MNKIVLGYDIRQHPERFVNESWKDDRREHYLLKSNIIWPLSVDILVWPSLFRYPSPFDNIKRFTDYIETCIPKEAIKVTAQNDLHEALDLWQDFSDMKNYFSKHNNSDTKGVMIATTLYSKGPIDNDEYWNAILYPPYKIDGIPNELSFIGYDVADNGMISGLCNCGYDNNEKKVLSEIWNSHLNEYGLFNVFDDAYQFSLLSDKRVPEHAPFYVYSLHADLQETDLEIKL